MGNKKETKFYIANIALPIILGGIVYWVWRSDTYVAEFITRMSGMKARNDLILFPNFFNRFMRNYFCDMVWAYALMFTLMFMIREQGAIRKIVILSMNFEVAIEVAQYVHLISGTFDVWDIALEWFATCVAGMIILKKTREKQK